MIHRRSDQETCKDVIGLKIVEKKESEEIYWISASVMNTAEKAKSTIAVRALKVRRAEKIKL